MASRDEMREARKAAGLWLYAPVETRPSRRCLITAKSTFVRIRSSRGGGERSVLPQTDPLPSKGEVGLDRTLLLS